jgi:hypothetical protein
VVFGEQLGEPGVETGEDGFFADVDGGGVLGMLAGIVAMDLASVVGTVMTVTRGSVTGMSASSIAIAAFPPPDIPSEYADCG